MAGPRIRHVGARFVEAAIGHAPGGASPGKSSDGLVETLPRWPARETIAQAIDFASLSPTRADFSWAARRFERARRRLKKAEPACKPGSVRRAHQRARPTAIPLGRRSRVGLSDQPGCGAGHAIAPLFGLAPGGVCRAVVVADAAVRSYRTVSPLPRAPKGAVRRSSLCCTFRRLAPPRRYLAPRPVEPGLSSPLARGGCPADSARSL